ncbi:hypothetical protein [Psychromicrobium lacuslunae]|nr:hypothetical protein [Psychromicrobium lacuslunae]
MTSHDQMLSLLLEMRDDETDLLSGLSDVADEAAEDHRKACHASE